MRYFALLLVGLIVMAVPLVGCSKKSDVDTSKLESSFKSAEPATRSAVDEAVASIKDGNYSDAIARLQGIASKAKPTPEQQQAIKDTIAAIQKHMAEMATKGPGDERKEVGDLRKSLPK